ncbi:MAG TPA: hypothetical protein PLD25_11645 [Chloroflexota bacterium]|nr:hypothetical protein [Chloroflexota bacterium]
MEVGPIQVIVFGFDRDDQFRGEILAEMLPLRGRGVIRLIDAFVARKSADGQIQAMEMEGLSAEETAVTEAIETLTAVGLLEAKYLDET